MNDEILKLANELKITCVNGDREEILTTFYRAAYNKAIEDVLKELDSWDNEKVFPSDVADELSSLEMK